MAIVKVPRAPESSMNQDRPVSSLLKTQILHLQEAEFRLPAKFQTNIYIHSLRTEGDAGEYIRQVTQAIHAAHATRKARATPKPQRAFEMAASAAVPRKRKAKAASKKKSRKPRAKK